MSIRQHQFKDAKKYYFINPTQSIMIIFSSLIKQIEIMLRLH